MAVNNARTIRATNPGLAITLVTNAPDDWDVLHEEFDRVVFRKEPDEANRLAKIRCHEVATAERVLYLDADAEVLGDLTPAFQLLDTFDLLIRPFDLPSKFPHLLGPGLDGQLLPQFWGGMAFFHRQRARLLFEQWERRFRSSGLHRDQPALARAIYDSSEVRLLPMNSVWGSFRRAGSGSDRPAPRIFHYADVSNDAQALAHCREVLADLGARIPSSDVDVTDTRRRFDRLASPLYRSRLTNRGARAWWRWSDRRQGRSGIDTRKKQPHVSGRPLSREEGPLWTEGVDSR